MGHIRLGRLPKTRHWSGVFNVLESDDITVGALARETAKAAEQQFASLENNSAVNYCFWVLLRIATASRSNDFTEELKNSLGIKSDKISSGLGFVQQVSVTVSKEIRERSEPSAFVRFAELSLREVLSANIIEQSQSLFGTSLEDIQSACKAFSTKKNFGQVAKQFYATLMSRSIQYLTDKEISNYINSNGSITSPSQAVQFEKALNLYCLQSAKIIEDFAAGWFSKHNWENNNDITEDSAKGFTSYALQKIQMELRGDKG